MLNLGKPILTILIWKHLRQILMKSQGGNYRQASLLSLLTMCTRSCVSTFCKPTVTFTSFSVNSTWIMTTTYPNKSWRISCSSLDLLMHHARTYSIYITTSMKIKMGGCLSLRWFSNSLICQILQLLKIPITGHFIYSIVLGEQVCNSI